MDERHCPKTWPISDYFLLASNRMLIVFDVKGAHGARAVDHIPVIMGRNGRMVLSETAERRVAIIAPTVGDFEMVERGEN
ncbi:hypothetical protein I7I49_09285 [Sinorhizobium meliloti]|uniref:hypothetical protein n=1 Tax=Rhizobium meliloti TaxID=382 RepID=UPI00237F4840|nr:hypothetical protein [Sinorhizobium meliloti]MDE3810473.1 hypothetical protein [Sinorhizobium meliloti]